MTTLSASYLIVADAMQFLLSRDIMPEL